MVYQFLDIVIEVLFLSSCTGGYMSCESVPEERWAEGGKHSVFYV